VCVELLPGGNIGCFVGVGFCQYEDHKQAVRYEKARRRMAPYRMGFFKGESLCMMSANCWCCIYTNDMSDRNSLFCKSVSLLMQFLWHMQLCWLCQLTGANGQLNIGKKVRLQLYQPPNASTPANNAMLQVCNHVLTHIIIIACWYFSDILVQ